MTTFYLAIQAGSGFDTSLEDQFDTEDNDKSVAEQAHAGILWQTSQVLGDGRTLFIVDDANAAVAAQPVGDRFETFLQARYPNEAARSAPGIARHFQTALLFMQPEDKKYLFNFQTYFDDNTGQLDEYAALFGQRSAWFRTHYYGGLVLSDPDSLIGKLGINFTDNIWGRDWIRQFVTGLDERFAATSPADTSDEARAAFIYNYLGDEAMNLYFRARDFLQNDPLASEPCDETLDKWELTEYLIRAQGTYSDPKSAGGYGVNCTDAPFTDAMDGGWSDECTTYAAFGGADQSISAIEWSQAAANAGADTTASKTLLDTHDKISALRRFYPGLGTIIYADIGVIANYVWTDRQGARYYSITNLSVAKDVAQLKYLRWQLSQHPDANAEYQTRALALLDDCLKFADKLKKDTAAALSPGTTTTHGTVLATTPLADGELDVICVRGMLSEGYDVYADNFDAYIRYLQGETPGAGDGSTTALTQCDGGKFTDVIDNVYDDECDIYHDLLAASVSRQRLDELYSYSHGAEAVQDVIEHFTQEAKVFTILERDDSDWGDPAKIAVDPVTHTVTFDGESDPNQSPQPDLLQKLATQLDQLDQYRIYARLIREKLPSLPPPPPPEPVHTPLPDVAPPPGTDPEEGAGDVEGS